MIAIKLREAMETYRRRTGERLTYESLAQLTGIAQTTLQTMGSRDDYNATLATIEKICRALEVPLDDLLELIDDPPKAKPQRGTKKTKKKKQ